MHDLVEHMKKATDRGVMKLSGIYKGTGTDSWDWPVILNGNSISDYCCLICEYLEGERE